MMRIVWTGEALDDLEEILAYYHREAGPRTAEAVERRIVAEIEALRIFPERIRASGRVPGARELVVRRLPYIVFVQVRSDAVVVLNIIHTARKFPGVDIVYPRQAARRMARPSPLSPVETPG